MSTDPRYDITWTDDGLKVTFTGSFDHVFGWPEGREDPGLNQAGPDAVDGVEICEERESYYDDDSQNHIAGYTTVVLLFDDVAALESAIDRLYQKAEERFEWGMTNEAGKVQELAGMFPSPYEAKQAREEDA